MDFVSSFYFLTELGCGYVLLDCFSKLLNYLGMFLMIGFCFKVLRFIWYVKSLIRFQSNFGGIPRVRLCLEKAVLQVSESKVAPLEKGRDDPLKSSAQNVNSPMKKVSSKEGLDGKDENERDANEDEMFDVIVLRKLVKNERQKANTACAELEEERTAAGSSAEEAMAMILRLQREKSVAEIQANQFRRMAEQKLDYDQEVIESLQWTITQHESQRSVLEEQIGIYREELKQYLTEDEINQLLFEASADESVASPSETESQTSLDGVAYGGSGNNNDEGDDIGDSNGDNHDGGGDHGNDDDGNNDDDGSGGNDGGNSHGGDSDDDDCGDMSGDNNNNDGGSNKSDDNNSDGGNHGYGGNGNDSGDNNNGDCRSKGHGDDDGYGHNGDLG